MPAGDSVNAVVSYFLPSCREPGLAAWKHMSDGAKDFPESCVLLLGLFCCV